MMYFSGNVVIYGDSIDAYSCIQTLMTLGVAGGRLHLVVPPKENEVVFHYIVSKISSHMVDKFKIHMYLLR